MESSYQKLARNIGRVLALFLLVVVALPLHADVKPSGIFSSNMVLQRDRDIVIWGWADKGERVRVTFNQMTKRTKADKDGTWRLVFPEMNAGGPYVMKIEGKNVITFDNILIGDLWVCSGQSNMGVAVKNALDPGKEIPEANFPTIRLMDIPRNMPTAPVADIKPASWKVCTPDNIPGFSAVAYFFGRELQREINVPIGLIHSSWGGSNVEAWTPMEYLTKVEKYKDYPAKLDETARQLEAGTELHPNKVHTSLYNGMIHPLINLPIKGVIWYQGESNAWEGKLYRTLFPNMIQCWRDRWQQPELPFLFVQLANYTDELPEPGPSNWASLREAQLLSLSVPNTAMTVAIDVGDAKDIHPKDKQTVGYRLSRNALKLVYGKPVADSGPIYESMKIDGDRIVLTFKHVEGGLVAKDKYGYLKSFAIAGADRKFYWAKATIDGNTVVVHADKVSNPVAVRYAWADNPGDANLYNAEGLPASPFRTDDW